MKKRILAFLLAVALMLSLVACGTGEESTATTADSESHEKEAAIFTDDLGRDVEIPAEISRIVPSGPLSQMLLFAIAPDMLVGLASNWNESAEGMIDETYYQLPYLGQLYDSADLNVEELALAAPQLVIDIGAERSSGVEDLNALQEQTGIPSVFLSASLETMPQTFRTLGKLLGREEKAEELAQFCERVYTRTLTIMEKVGENKVDALYVLGEKGLNVLAYDSYHSELMDLLTNNLAVVENPVSKGTGNEVTMEQIALWDPEFVVFAPGSIYDAVGEMAAWQEIRAISDHRYVEVPDGPYIWMGNPPGVQRYLGLIWLTAVLYPEYCDYDVKAEVREYYKLFYGTELTEEQYNTLTVKAFLE